ncbi:MAG: sigma-70 family RNA polymerase sigma factor [Planctomycetota bacterium]
METTRPESVRQDLLALLPGLRRLAGRLLRDDEADDVVQETAVVALGGSAAPLRAGWLRGVTRNLSRRHVREATRRRRREALVARPEAVAAAADVVSVAERTRVLQHLALLDERYRRAIELRYFEDLPPREVAARLDLPVETVRTHVRRGIEQLRMRLDVDHRSDRRGLERGLALLAGLQPRGARWAPLLAGGLLVALLGMGAVLWWPTEDADGPLGSETSRADAMSGRPDATLPPGLSGSTRDDARGELPAEDLPSPPAADAVGGRPRGRGLPRGDGSRAARPTGDAPTVSASEVAAQSPEAQRVTGALAPWSDPWFLLMREPADHLGSEDLAKLPDALVSGARTRLVGTGLAACDARGVSAPTFGIARFELPQALFQAWFDSQPSREVKALEAETFGELLVRAMGPLPASRVDRTRFAAQVLASHRDVFDEATWGAECEGIEALLARRAPRGATIRVPHRPPPASWPTLAPDPALGRHPVHGLSLAEALEVAAWFDSTLPDEITWELAARRVHRLDLRGDRQVPWDPRSSPLVRGVEPPPPSVNGGRPLDPERVPTVAVDAPDARYYRRDAAHVFGNVAEWTASAVLGPWGTVDKRERPLRFPTTTPPWSPWVALRGGSAWDDDPIALLPAFRGFLMEPGESLEPNKGDTIDKLAGAPLPGRRLQRAGIRLARFATRARTAGHVLSAWLLARGWAPTELGAWERAARTGPDLGPRGEVDLELRPRPAGVDVAVTLHRPLDVAWDAERATWLTAVWPDDRMLRRWRDIAPAKSSEVNRLVVGLVDLHAPPRATQAIELPGLSARPPEAGPHAVILRIDGDEHVQIELLNLVRGSLHRVVSDAKEGDAPAAQAELVWAKRDPARRPITMLTAEDGVLEATFAVVVPAATSRDHQLTVRLRLPR